MVIHFPMFEQRCPNPLSHCSRIAEQRDDALLVITERTMSDMYEAQTMPTSRWCHRSLKAVSICKKT